MLMVFFDWYEGIKSGFLQFSCIGSITTASFELFVECMAIALGYFDDNYIDHQLDLEGHSNEILVVEGALGYGYGDIQITLTWDDGADLDLHVIDPYGEEIYFDNPTSASGGWLDIDDINGYGPENVFWPENQAPSGEYHVYVHDYDSNSYGSSNYTVLINAFGTSRIYNGSILDNQLIHIESFGESGVGRYKLDKKINISTPVKSKY